jgi:hypothetical protein
MTKIERAKFLNYLFLIILSVSAQNNENCCLTYDSAKLCLTCPDGTYYSANNCIVDL